MPTYPLANFLLGALPAQDLKGISADLNIVSLKVHQNLRKRDEPLRQIYFPSRALCSLTITMSDGTTAEISAVGPEGLIGVEAVLGLTTAMSDATVQIAGDGAAYVMSVDAFRHALDQGGAFHSRVTKYAQAFVGSITQSVVCNALHSADARCSRWLLHAQDSLGTSEFPVTHELLSSLLGVRRPTVTLIMTDLARLGIISTGRGVTRITERTALEGRSCECYKTVKRLFDNQLSSEPCQAPVALTT
jgi:CRP-like cAMP-binding protein